MSAVDGLAQERCLPLWVASAQAAADSSLCRTVNIDEVDAATPASHGLDVGRLPTDDDGLQAVRAMLRTQFDAERNSTGTFGKSLIDKKRRL